MEDDRIGEMPAIEADKIRNFVCDDVRRPILRCRPHHVDRSAGIERHMLSHAPCATNVILQPCPTDRRMVLVSVTIDLDFSFSIPAHVVVEHPNTYCRSHESSRTL